MRVRVWFLMTNDMFPWPPQTSAKLPGRAILWSLWSLTSQPLAPIICINVLGLFFQTWTLDWNGFWRNLMESSRRLVQSRTGCWVNITDLPETKAWKPDWVPGTLQLKVSQGKLRSKTQGVAQGGSEQVGSQGQPNQVQKSRRSGWVLVTMEQENQSESNGPAGNVFPLEAAARGRRGGWPAKPDPDRAAAKQTDWRKVLTLSTHNYFLSLNIFSWIKLFLMTWRFYLDWVVVSCHSKSNTTVTLLEKLSIQTRRKKLLFFNNHTKSEDLLLI